MRLEWRRSGWWPRWGAVLLLVGTGKCSFAQSAALLLPAAVAYDSGGNLFFVDTNRNQVFEVTLAGVLSVVAGTGEQGFGGDGSAATAALLNGPQGVAVGPDETVYVADTGNHRVRAIASGMISTFAGTGVAGFLGDGGSAAGAELAGPVGLAMDATGALLICDAGNQRVRRVSAGTISTFAGSGVEGFGGDGAAATAALLDGPLGVAVLPDGRVVIADAHNQRLRMVTGGVISTFAGTGAAGFAGDDGAAMTAKLALPRGVTVDSLGDVIFADSNNQRLRMVSAAGAISTIAGAGWQGIAADGTVATGGSLDTPRGVGVSGFGAPVFADAQNGLVREVAANGALYTVAVVQPARVTAVSLKVGAALVYGEGAAAVGVSGTAGTPLGTVSVLDGGSTVGTASLASGAGSVGLMGLGVGAHVLTASYAGDGVNPAAVSSAASVNVVQASSSTSLASGTGSYAGLPIVMSATVAPEFAGVPTGAVQFEDGGVVVATAPLVKSVATGTYLTPAAGSHMLSAVYAGDNNFVGSASAAAGVTVVAMPDFSVTSAGPAQTVQGGLVASYPLTVSAVGGPFTGSVSFSVAGMQSGAVVSFLPPVVVPGSANASTVMSVQTVELAGSRSRGLVWLGLPVMVVCCWRRRRWALSVLLVATMGCGARTVSSAAIQSRTFTVTVTGTSTNLAGAVVTHSTVVALTVE